MRCLTDNDRHFGPITYGRASWNPFSFVISSGDDDEEVGNSLTAYAFGWVLKITLPRWIEPYNKDSYYSVHPREYGFTVYKGFLQIFFGPQTVDSTTTKGWSCDLPWLQWRLHKTNRDDIQEVQKFELVDFDGQHVIATTKIDECEYRLGHGWFKWMSWFSKPKFIRSLSISFSEEVGPEKGSYKGGILGTSQRLAPQDTHESGMRQYCLDHAIRFIGKTKDR